VKSMTSKQVRTAANDKENVNSSSSITKKEKMQGAGTGKGNGKLSKQKNNTARGLSNAEAATASGSASANPSAHHSNKQYKILTTSLEPVDERKLEKFVEKFSTATIPIPGAFDGDCDRDGTCITDTRQQKQSSTTSRVGGLNQRASVSVCDSFDRDVTHLVVSVDKHGELKKRTMKFMQAIMGELVLASMRQRVSTTVSLRSVCYSVCMTYNYSPFELSDTLFMHITPYTI
jgi:hypothetical protein